MKNEKMDGWNDEWNKDEWMDEKNEYKWIIESMNK